MVQQKVEELVHFHSDWCLHCYVMVGGDRWRACKSGEATQDERGAEANSLLKSEANTLWNQVAAGPENSFQEISASHPQSQRQTSH